MKGARLHSDRDDAHDAALNLIGVPATNDQLVQRAVERRVSKRGARRAAYVGVDAHTESELRRDLRYGRRDRGSRRNVELADAALRSSRHGRLLRVG